MKFKTTLESSFSLIDLTPLVDVIFLMLIFFIITSDILPLKSLNIENPTLDLKSESRTTQILVVMDAENVIYVGSKKEIVDFNSFKETLLKNISFCPQATVVLSIDKNVDYGSFLRLFAAAQETHANIRLVYHECSR